jgi:hypothetical protein
MTYIKIFIYCLILCVLGIAGCSSSENTSGGFGSGTTSCSGFGSDSGFSINLCVTQSLVPQGGEAILIASVKDNQGNFVNDSSRGVTFSSTQGATITKDEDKINLGSCTAIYKAPTSTTLPNAVIDRVTATYQGAFAHVSIEVFKQ